MQRKLFDANDVTSSEATTQKLHNYSNKLRKDKRALIIQQKRLVASISKGPTTCWQSEHPQIQLLIEPFIINSCSPAFQSLTRSLNLDNLIFELRNALAPRETAISYPYILKNTCLLQYIMNILQDNNSSMKLQIEAVYLTQNLSLISQAFEDQFEPFISIFNQIISQNPSLDQNLFILKEAAVKCLACICVDSDQMWQKIDMQNLFKLVQFKRVQLTESVLWLLTNLISQNIGYYNNSQSIWKENGLYTVLQKLNYTTNWKVKVQLFELLNEIAKRDLQELLACYTSLVQDLITWYTTAQSSAVSQASSASSAFFQHQSDPVDPQTISSAYEALKQILITLLSHDTLDSTILMPLLTSDSLIQKLLDPEFHCKEHWFCLSSMLALDPFNSKLTDAVVQKIEFMIQILQGNYYSNTNNIQITYLERKEVFVLIYYIAECNDNTYLKKMDKQMLNAILAVFYDQMLHHEQADPHLVQICLSFINMCFQELRIEIPNAEEIQTVISQIESKYSSVETNQEIASMAGVINASLFEYQNTDAQIINNNHNPAGPGPITHNEENMQFNI